MKKKRLSDFFRAEYGKLVRYVRRSIDDTADREAEDIVQDVITNLFDKADFSLPVENLAAYVYRSARNKIVDLFRKKKHTPLSLDAATAAPGPGSGNDNSYTLADILHDPELDVVTAVEKSELYEHLYQAIGRLTDREQAVVIATEFDGQPFARLAAEWDVPMGTLLARKARALKKIKQELAAIFKGGTLPSKKERGGTPPSKKERGGTPPSKKEGGTPPPGKKNAAATLEKTNNNKEESNGK